MTTLDKFKMAVPDVNLLLIDGYDEAFIGVELKESRAVYSMTKCAEVFRQKNPKMSLQAAYIGAILDINIKTKDIAVQPPIFSYDFY